MNNDNSNTTQAFWVLLGSFSAFFVSILSAALLSRFLSKEDYGTYRQILYVYNTLLVVFSAGLPRIFQYFLPRHEINEGKSIVNRVTNLLLLLGLFFSLFLYFFSDQIANLLSNQELSIGLKYFSPIPFLLLPTLGIEGIFASYKKTKYIAKYNVITRFLQLLGIVVPVILFDGGYLMAIFGWSITSLITLLIAIYFKNIPFVKIASISKTKLSYKEIFSYSLPLVFASLAGIAFKSANQFYISRYFGAEIFAEYANGFMELPFVVMITGATSTVMMPLFSKMFYDKDSVSSILKVWNNAIVKSAIIIYPLVVFFIANAQNIMVILYTAKYSNSGIYFKINLVVNFLNIVIFAPLFFSMGKTKLYARIHVFFAVLIWILNFILVKVFMNPFLIAFASTFLQSIMIIYVLIVASLLLKVKFSDIFPIKLLLLLIVHTSLVMLIVTYLINYFEFTQIVVKVILSAIAYFLLLLLTAPIFKINYLESIMPIINKLNAKVK